MMTHRTRSLRNKVRKQAKKDREKRKEEQRKTFAKAYNRIKKYTFRKKEEISVEKHVYLPKKTAMCGLSTRALTVYPVLCSRADFEENKWFQFPQEAIATLSGLSVPVVKKAILELCTCRVMLDRETPLLEVKRAAQGKRRFYVYRTGFIRKGKIQEWEQQFFIFHTCIIDSGVWARLTPRAKTLYLAMRGAAFFDPETYGEIEFGVPLCPPYKVIPGYDFGLTGKEYRNRNWDIFYGSLSTLCKLAGISPVNLNSTVLTQLEEVELIERVGGYFTKVYLKPKDFRDE